MAKNFLKLLPIDKFAKFVEIIKSNGGVRSSIFKMFRYDDLKDGKLVGCDNFGNRYYENPRYFYGRNRWVEYADHVYLDYDGSQIPAEWFGWLHYRTDKLPCDEPWRPNYFWMQEHTENLTGTPRQYMPYSTTKPKIQAWKPPSCKNDTEA